MDRVLITSVDDAKKHIGKRLKSEIQNKRYSYRQISDATGISYSYLSDVANGKYLPSVEVVYKISNFIGSNIRELLYGLEYWIKPKGISFSNIDLLDNDFTTYYDLLDKEIKSLDIIENSIMEEKQGLKNKITLTLNSMVMTDNSMDLLGIFKGSTLTFRQDEVKFESGKIHLIKHEGKDFIRKVIDADGYYIIIPYSSNHKYEVQKLSKDAIEILGLVSSVTTILL